MKQKLNTLKQNLLMANKEEQTQLAVDFVKNISYTDVYQHICELHNADPFSLAYKLISSPPHVLPIFDFSNFFVEVIHWIYTDDPEMKAFNEDIHDHFGTIVSVALKGSPYRNFNFCKDKNGSLKIDEDFIFEEGTVHIIKADTIHRVVMQPNQSAVSLRVLLPATSNICYVYNEDGSIFSSIENALARKERAINQLLLSLQ